MADSRLGAEDEQDEPLAYCGSRKLSTTVWGLGIKPEEKQLPLAKDGIN